MSLNPVQFGTEIVDQFGRYLMTTFPIADPRMEQRVREALRHDVGGERGPYVYINQPLQEVRSVAALCAEPKLGLHRVLQDVFPYEAVHMHQERTQEAVKASRHTIVATGTGSGKTEAYISRNVDHVMAFDTIKTPPKRHIGGPGSHARGVKTRIGGAELVSSIFRVWRKQSA